MKRTIARCLPLLAAATLAVPALPLGSCQSCDSGAGDRQAAAAGPRKASPAARPPRPVKPRQAGKAHGTLKEELSTISVKTVSGEVTLVPQAGEAARPAREGDEILGGGEIVVGVDGSASVVVREVGHLALAPGSVLVVPAHSLCGAILVEGAALTAGPARERRDPRCYLHTAGGALLHPRAKAIIAAAPSGKVRIAATDGAVRVVLPTGEPIEIRQDHQVVLDPRQGLVGQPAPFVRDDGPAERTFDGWLKAEAFGGAAQAGWMLDEAGRHAERLALDVERLVELMTLNREASAQRRALSLRPAPDGGQAEELTEQLARQAEELVMLKDKGMLLINRVLALVELTRRHAPAAKPERVATILAGLDKLAADLPPLFERRRKPAVSMDGRGRPKPERPMPVD
jgi:hypothetical protein